MREQQSASSKAPLKRMVELYTYREEADTRMFLHESHASLHEHQTVTIASSKHMFLC